MIDYSPLFKKLKDEDISIGDLSEATDISQSTFSRMKNGNDITLSKMLELSRQLGCRVEDLVTKGGSDMTNSNYNQDSVLSEFESWKDETIRSNSRDATVLKELLTGTTHEVEDIDFHESGEECSMTTWIRDSITDTLSTYDFKIDADDEAAAYAVYLGMMVTTVSPCDIYERRTAEHRPADDIANVN